MVATNDVVIIGGGAAGCATSYYLAKKGVKSTIIEREGIASQASGFSAGGLNPLQGAGIPGSLASFALKSFRMHEQIWPELLTTGINFNPELTSVISIAYEEREVLEMEETHKIFMQAPDSFYATWLDSGQIHEFEPAVAPRPVMGLKTHGNAILNSYRFVLALAQSATDMGATIRHGNVVGIKTSGRRVDSVVLEDGEIECQSVVFATGPWSNLVEECLHIKIPVNPLKGEIIRVALPNHPQLKHDYQGCGVTLNHRNNGEVWIGATETRAGFDIRPTIEAHDFLMKGARDLMPALSDAQLILQTACLRPVTKDWLPILGPVPEWDNIFLAMGAGKKGILLSPGMGEAVATLVTGGRLDETMTRFKYDRFLT